MPLSGRVAGENMVKSVVAALVLLVGLFALSGPEFAGGVSVPFTPTTARGFPPPLHCGMHGKSVDGKCFCAPGWTGSACDHLLSDLSWSLLGFQRISPMDGFPYGY